MCKRKFFILCLCGIMMSCKSEIQSQEKMLKVKEIEFKGQAGLEQVSRLLEEHAELQAIDLINWDQFSYRPSVAFRIAHSNNAIWIKYYVKEKNILASVGETNGPVARDSCVEFFFDPLGNGDYYNFEFNCIGTVHLAYGAGRGQRQFVDPNTIKNLIEVQSSLGSQTFTERTGDFSWEMTIIIPAEILTHNPEIKLKGLKSTANFYKCGDATSQRHYLTWNSVGTEKPDYHRPEFFGKLIFQ
ncbi:carbohydrate-binding family 9 [Arenibacter algicola]|uniref:Carbohydrate-binding family 9 n=2 Tax=Arenibacter algicola TaxID=616991 RepID=A0A221UTX3_9FLAO|nr:carbohydrate-binding family 9 [Arenibacter algicola]